MPVTPQELELIGSADAEQILNISRATLSRWVTAGKLRTAGRLSSGVLVFDRRVVEALAAEIREQQPAERSA